MFRLLRIFALLCLAASSVMAQQPDEKSRDKESPSPSSPAENPSLSTQLLRSFQTIRVQTDTWLAKPEMCEGALQKRREFETWELSVVRAAHADVVVKIDHQPGWFYYQYSVVHTPSQTVLASGNVSAWDGTVACKKVADLLIDRIKRARPVPKKENKDQKDKKDGQT